jgi:transmembrane sensor
MKLPFITRRRRIREDALAWLARLRRGLRADEGSELLEWLKRRSHRACMVRAAAERDSPEALAILSEIFPIRPEWVEPPQRRNPAVGAVAALIAFCIAALPLVATHQYLPGLMFGTAREGSLMEAWGTVYASAPGTLRRVGLADGTRVVMNRGTRMAVVYSEHMRAVQLTRGEATFTVAHEPHRPFHLTVAGRAFETSAATFNARLNGMDAMELTVLEGTVTVFPSHARTTVQPAALREGAVRILVPTVLEAHQTLYIEPGEDSARTLSEHDAQTRIAWQRG